MNSRNIISEIKKRCIDVIWENAALVSAEAAQRAYCTLQHLKDATCFWEDIDYTDQNMAFWGAALHYARTLDILQHYGSRRLAEDKLYRQRMIGCLRYWTKHNFENPNWWYNQIGAPQALSQITLLLESYLDKGLFDEAVQQIKQGVPPNIPLENWTGCNLLWGVSNSARYALLQNDIELLKDVCTLAGKELEIGNTEGIQPDGSFFQHGPRLYSGGYGRDFAYNISQLVYMLQHTPLQFSAEQLNVLQSHMPGGLWHMIQCNTLDWACTGREMTRPTALAADKLTLAARYLLKTEEIPGKQELENFIKGTTQGFTPDRTHYFSNAHLLCHHFDGIYAAAKFMAPDIQGAEKCNEEGELCYNMSYGTHMCIMRTGEEYADILPVWNYSRIPGTTARPECDEELLTHDEWWAYRLPSDHCGGKQQDDRAVVYQQTQHDGITLYTADFAFEHGFVCLGSQICDIKNCSDGLITTIDQCEQHGNAMYKDGNILHNGIRYTPLHGTKIDYQCVPQSGSWHRNNFALSSQPITKNVFTAFIHHPTGAPGNYAYMISSAELTAPNVTVLRNDAYVQAIQLPDGGIMAVFHAYTELNAGFKTIHHQPGIYIETP